MDTSSRIFVAGHRGLVGSAVVRRLKARGCTNVLQRTHHELDLERQEKVEAFFAAERPAYVILAAAVVGGIGDNSGYPADFITKNLAIALNVIEASRRYGVSKLMNLGSSCIYPKFAPQPVKEEHLLTGPLEPTNEPYAIAKIAAIKLCSSMNRQFGTDFMSLMPNNLYGPGDNYDLEKSHVLPALIRKFHDAKTTGSDRVLLWGDGSPLREFLYSDDLADAVVFLMERYSVAEAGELLNVGTGEELSIGALAETVREVVYEDSPGRRCTIEWDSSKPNGTPRKLLDVSRLSALGWRSRTPLAVGLKAAYRDFLKMYGGEKSIP
ncbi:MAG: GDP-L-fucose synthase [Spirochaetia bacterium]|jgi:GDP-L-fucose synthase